MIMQQQNQPVVRRLGFLHGLQIGMLGPDAGDQPGEKSLQGFLVIQLGIPHPEKKIVAFRGEGQGRQGLPDLAGEHFPENGHIILVFLLIERGHGKLKAGDRVADIIDVAAADQRRIALIRIQAAFDFRQVMLVHGEKTSFPYKK